jgi:hypothetical protein
MIKLVTDIRWFIHGIIGLIKAITGIDRAPREIIEERKKTCEKCTLRSGYKCTHCGCFLPAKIRVYSEICPIYMWY